jgi:hypothetical protein
LPFAEGLTVAVTSKLEPLISKVWVPLSDHVFGDPDVFVSVIPLPDAVTVALPSRVCSALVMVSLDSCQVPAGQFAFPPPTGGNVTAGRHAVPIIPNAPIQATAMSLRARTVFMFPLPVPPNVPASSETW